MESKVLLAVVAGLLYWWGQLQVGYCFIEAFSWSPLIHGVVFGLVTGRMQECIIMGAAIFTLYVSLIDAGGNQPEDSVAAGAITIPIALMNNMDIATATTLSVTFALVGNVLQPIQFNLNNIVAHVADKYAAAGDYKGVVRTNYLSALFAFLVRFPAAFCAVYFGAEAVDTILNIVPEWLMHGLEVSGEVLPAMGIAVTLHVISKEQYLPAFLIGYFFVVFFEVSTLGASVFGISAIALYTIISIEKDKETAVALDDE